MAVELLHQGISPLEVARALSSSDARGLLFFDSGRAGSPAHASATSAAPALASHIAARWSIIVCEPDDLCCEPEHIAGWLKRHHPSVFKVAPNIEGLPFYGGVAGMLGFEFGWSLHDLNVQPCPRETPDIWVAHYPSALVYCHREERWWLTGDAQSRASFKLRGALWRAISQQKPASMQLGTSVQKAFDKRQNTASPAAPRRSSHIMPGTVSSPPRSDFRMTITPETYAERAARVVDAIKAGTVDEVNYTERFNATWRGEAFSLYEELRERSTGGYCAYLDAGDFQLLSLSPEQFLTVVGDQIITRPIKGTRPRGDNPAQDAALARELVSSPKDRAENIMTVEAVKAELAEVCQPDTVQTAELCALYSFSGVHHLISTVIGALESAVSPIQAMLACFPPGSITGAPKLRSMELIATLEEDARGPYTGALFYACGTTARLDSSVLIRTVVLQGEQVRYGAGGAVVAQSDPEAEYREACVKARAVARFFGTEI